MPKYGLESNCGLGFKLIREFMMVALFTPLVGIVLTPIFNQGVCLKITSR